MCTIRPMSGVRRLRVSLVDDDESCRESLALLLQVLGYDVRAFASIEALLGVLPELETDCLLLDATTRGATGRELLEAVNDRPSVLPFVFVTGYMGGERQRELLAFGASSCLEKPVDEDLLVGALERAASGGKTA